ncbi:MAG: cytochrome C [Rhodospirillaceae bacterium]|nr:cytochrome C [Rhodospirillaceae bacterium]MBT5896907.1 cytochrome C [Rhodospirillaceae bacterium]
MTRKIEIHGELFSISGGAAALGVVLGGLLFTPLSLNTASAAGAGMASPLVIGAAEISANISTDISTDIIGAAPAMSQPLLLAQAKKKDDDDLLGKDDDDDDDDDNLLKDDDDDDEEKKETEATGKPLTKAGKEHAALFAESRYPSATTCGTCHPRHFEEWAVSQHSYAQLSPAYMALQNFINLNVNGTNGDFCIRCHNQVGMNMEEPVGVSNLERHPTSREGITCIVCHRVANIYNKASGRVALVEGDLLQPVYGPAGDKELKRVLANRNEYRVVTKADEPGRKIHTEAIEFKEISSSTFCGTCHDVTLLNGFRLEEAFSEYRDSPAAAEGITCQDCHMGKVQGIVSGYHEGPAAVVGGVPTKSRKLTNHIMAGPDYSLLPPGIFPHNAEAQQLATLSEWLTFDVAAGWGTDKFEDNVPAGMKFPKAWESIDARYDGREIIDYQLKRLAYVRTLRLEVLRNGYFMSDVKATRANGNGIDIQAKVSNITTGHNTPTGFTGERLVWIRITVMDADGKVVFQSGDTDANGDVRDNESAFVHAGELPLDTQLFNLQSRFLVQSVRGGERERTVTIPYSTTALPFLRPTRLSLVLTGESTVERNHRKGIEPLGHRIAKYEIPGSALTGKGPYKAKVELLAQMFPINLISTIQVVGFDYGISPRAAANAVVAGREVLYEETISIDVK